MSEEISHIKAERAPKRYRYVVAAKAEINKLVFEIQLLNISKSGIQFACDVKIENSNTINIKWSDVDSGNFDTTFIIVREVDDFDETKFHYCYGAKYLDTTPETKEQLLALIRRLKTQDLEQNKHDLEKITPEYLFQLIDEDINFLKNTIFLGKQIPPYLENLVQNIQNYERDSFPKSDEASKCIQTLTTHHFHFNVFLKAVPIMTQNEELRLKFLKYVKEKIDQTVQLEAYVRVVSKDLNLEMISDEDKSAFRKKIAESNNRLFYARLALLQVVAERFNSIESTSSEFKDTLEKINKEHKRILKLIEYQKSNPVAENSKRLADKPKTKSSKSWLSSSWKICLPVIILLLGAMIVWQQSHKPESPTTIFVRELGVAAPIKSFTVNQTRIDLVVFDKGWGKLKQEQKNEIFKKIVLYLQSHNQTPVAALFTEQRRLIKLLYTTSVISD